MLKGYNSDITVRGMKYHVQTEDWGSERMVLVSRVFQNGAVIKSIKTPYSDALQDDRNRSDLGLALRNQHNEILDQLVSGHLLSESLK